MRKIREAHWIAVVEEGDTASSVAAWIEENVMPDNDGRPSLHPYQPGDVDYDSWSVDPSPGDVFVFQAPPPHMTVRYPGWSKEVEEPMSQAERESLEELRTATWRPSRRTFKELIVDMSTLVKSWFREEI